MRGITSWGAYLPHWRLDRSTVAAVAGQGGGRGTRTVASFDQDTTTLAVEAARLATGDTGSVDQVLFATTSPAYADKTNATTIHAALGLPGSVAAWDLGSSARSAAGGLVLAANSPVTSLVVAADIRTGRAGSADESAGGDGAAAVVVADDAVAPVAAEFLGSASATVEAVDRWRAPGDRVSRTWDERFAEVVYRPAVAAAFADACAAAGLSAGDVDVAVVAAPTARLGAAMARGLGVARIAEDWSATVGNTGAAHGLVCLAAELERLAADPDTAGGGTVVALVAVGDGCDVTLWRTTPALAGAAPVATVATQAASGVPVAYGRYLAWRGLLDVEPPRRPEPARVSAPAAWRSSAWKFAFTASRDTTTGRIHLPPSRVSADGGRTDDMEPVALASALGTVATFTVDRVAYSPSPPIIFAVVDFDGGGRFPVELCDLSPDEVAIGSRVALTFRRLHAADDIPNYFWKARLVRPDGPTDAEDTH